VEGEGFRLEPGPRRGLGEVDEVDAGPGPVLGRWEVVGEGGVGGADVGDRLHDAGRLGQSAEPIGDGFPGPGQCSLGGAVHLLCGLEAERRVVAEAVVDHGDVVRPEDLPTEAAVLVLERGDLVETDPVDLAGIEVERGVPLHRPPIDLLTVGEPAHPRLLGRARRGEDVGGDGVAIPVECRVDHLRDLLLHGLFPPSLLQVVPVVGEADLQERVLLHPDPAEGVELADDLLDGDAGRGPPVGHTLAMALDRLVERLAHLRGLLHERPRLLAGGGAELGNPLDDVHVQAEHWVDQELGGPAAQGSADPLGLGDQHVPGDAVVAFEGRRVDRPGGGDDRIELLDHLVLVLTGQILDLGVEAVVAEEARPHRRVRQRDFPEPGGEIGELLVHGTSWSPAGDLRSDAGAVCRGAVGRPGAPVHRHSGGGYSSV